MSDDDLQPLPNGTRIVKSRPDFDEHAPVGTAGTVLGNIGPHLGLFVYFVEWDGCAGELWPVVSARIAEADDSPQRSRVHGAQGDPATATSRSAPPLLGRAGPRGFQKHTRDAQPTTKGDRMRRLVLVLVVAALAVPAAALAGSPHFVPGTTVTQSGSTLTASGKEAGLGDEQQVHIVLSATASCINPGGNHPKAANKQTVSAAGDFPVQNGKALFDLSVTAAFQPECSPPMSVVFSDVTVTDTTNGVTL